MHGQIASFKETLGLSYDEIVEKIPYRNLLLMQYDKLKEDYSDDNQTEEVTEISGEEMRKRKRGK